jgi:hypothetical protein
MNPATLESLLMDDALGALAPEVHVLLEAYLATDEPARRRWLSLHKLTDQSSRALADRITPDLPPFPRRHLESRRRSDLIVRFTGAGAALAACVLLSFVLGLWWRPAIKATPTVAAGPAPAIPAPPAPAQVAQVRDFWSLPRLAAYAERTAAQVPAPRRDSSLRQTPTGGNL